MKKAEKIETNGLIVREVVTPEVGGRIKEGGLPYAPDEVEAVWRKAVGGLAWQVAFGAMLCELDAVLTRENGKSANQYKDGNGGLQAWLSERCPAVNYKTAMRWKAMAQGVMDKALPDGEGTILPAEVPVLLGLLPKAGTSFGSNEDRKREALEKFLDGRSQNDVYAALRGPGRPKGVPGGGRRALTAAEKTADAEDELKELLGKLAAYCTGPKLLMLPEERRTRTAASLKDLAARFLEGRPF